MGSSQYSTHFYSPNKIHNATHHGGRHRGGILGAQPNELCRGRFFDLMAGYQCGWIFWGRF